MTPLVRSSLTSRNSRPSRHSTANRIAITIAHVGMPDVLVVMFDTIQVVFRSGIEPAGVCTSVPVTEMSPTVHSTGAPPGVWAMGPGTVPDAGAGIGAGGGAG